MTSHEMYVRRMESKGHNPGITISQLLLLTKQLQKALKDRK